MSRTSFFITRSISRRSLSLTSSRTSREAAWMAMRWAPASREPGANSTSPLKERMPMVGLWPMAESRPAAKACTVKRLRRASTTKRVRTAAGAAEAAPSSWSMRTVLLRAAALHGAQAEVAFHVGHDGRSDVADSQLRHVAADDGIGKHEAGAEDHERHTAQHVESVLAVGGSVGVSFHEIRCHDAGSFRLQD